MSAPPYPKIECRFRRNEDHTLNLAELKRPEFGLVDRWMVTEKIDGTNIRISLEPERQIYPRRGLPSSVREVRPLMKAQGATEFTAPVPWVVRFYGRTNRAQMPDFIQEYLEATFKLDAMTRLWQCRRNCVGCHGTGQADPLVDPPKPFKKCPNSEPYPITLYGEAYGAGIQKGGNYRRDGDISFRLFDVLVGESWLGWDSVVSIANDLGIKTVPVMAEALGPNIITRIVADGFKSLVAEEEGTPRLAEGMVARTDPYLFDGNGRRVVWKIKTRDFSRGA